MVRVILHFSQEGFVAEDDFSATADYTREHDEERAFTEARQAADAANADAVRRSGGAATGGAAASTAGAGPADPHNGLCLLPAWLTAFDDRNRLLNSRHCCHLVFAAAIAGHSLPICIAGTLCLLPL